MALVFDLKGKTACVTGASSGLGRVAANAPGAYTHLTLPTIYPV